MSAGRWIQALAGAVVLHTAAIAPAMSDVMFTESCIGGGGFFTGSSNCVLMKRKGPIGPAGIRYVAEPRSEEEIEAAKERDRKWLARCNPVIRQDAYGVGRYYYAKPGCEFGKLDDH